MATRYVIAALTRTGKLRRVCTDARENKAQADLEARQLQQDFAPNPVIVVPEDTFNRNAE